MDVSTSPWVRLLRSMSIRGLFVLGTVLLVVAVGGIRLLFNVPREVLHTVGPLLAIAGGIGLAALLFGVFRRVLAGGRAVRITAATVGVLGAASGGVAWYSLSVAQPEARGACWRAAHGSSVQEREGGLVEGKPRLEGFFFRLAQLLKDDPGIARDCAYADTDEVRRAHGLCLRAPTRSQTCRCGYQDLPQDAKCPAPACVLEEGTLTLRCERPDPVTPR